MVASFLGDFSNKRAQKQTTNYHARLLRSDFTLCSQAFNKHKPTPGPTSFPRSSLYFEDPGNEVVPGPSAKTGTGVAALRAQAPKLKICGVHRENCMGKSPIFERNCVNNYFN